MTQKTPSSRQPLRQSLPDLIADDLRERILNGELSEGEVIRQEALADDYEVSRMPVREALKRLDGEGLVALINNRGASVTKHSLEEIGEIFDVRALLEVDLFRRSIPNLTVTQLDTCADILRRLDNSYDRGAIADWGKLNFEFHGALYAGAARSLSSDLLQRVNVQADRYVRLHLMFMDHREIAKSEHQDLLALARAGAVDEACAILQKHIERARDQLIDLVAISRASETGL